MIRIKHRLLFRMPAEWERHEATWLAWPANGKTWPGNALGGVQKLYVEMIRLLSLGEKVCLLVRDEKEKDVVSKRVRRAGIHRSRVLFFLIPTIDSWIRDYGAIFIISRKRSNFAGRMIATRWIFNAWGNKYDDLLNDTSVSRHMALQTNTPYIEPHIILEGGSIDVNGRGSALVTESCLLNSNRNSHLGKSQIEAYLSKYLGTSNVLWLKGGLAGDDTDGHIDNLARFVSCDTIVYAYENDPSSIHYKMLCENRKRLARFRDERGRKLKLIPLPMPHNVMKNGKALPASYVNFYIGNSVVLVPTYNDPNDSLAVGVIQKLFPSRQTIGLDARALIVGRGSIHCVTKEQPYFYQK